MLVKAPVLGRDERFLHGDRNVPQRPPDAAIALREVGEMLASGIEYPAGLRYAAALETARVGQISHRGVIESDHFGKVHRSIVFVLTELSVDREEAVEFQPVGDLDLARDRRRISHHGLVAVVWS